MVEVMVAYRKGVDLEYYLNKHIPIAKQAMPLVGCQRLEVRRFQPAVGGTPEYEVMTTLYFPSMEAFQAGMQHPAMAEALQDVKNFYHGEPDFLISEKLVSLEA